MNAELDKERCSQADLAGVHNGDAPTPIQWPASGSGDIARPALPGQRHSRSVLVFGVVVAVVLAGLLGWVLTADRHNRIVNAQRQALVLVTSTKRMLRLEFRMMERAMQGLADERTQLALHVPERAEAMIGDSVRGVVERHDEIESIVVLDPRGQALSPGRDDPALPQWAQPQVRGPHRDLYIGPLERMSGGGWVLRLGLLMDDGNWLLLRLRIDELQSMLGQLDLGRNGVVSVIGSDDSVLIRKPYGDRLTGTRVAAPLAGIKHDYQAVPLGAMYSALDGHERIAAAAALREYPVQVYAGIDYAETLAPWMAFLGMSIALYAVYWSGLLYLLANLRRSERRHGRLLRELREGDEELRLAHQVGGIGTWSLGADGRRLHWSVQTRQMFGLQGSQLDLMDFIRAVHREDRRRTEAAFRDAWQGGAALELIFRLFSPSGALHWVAVRGARVDDGPGLRRMTGTVVDISERIEVQTMAYDAQRQFRFIFELNPLPCWLFDVETLRFIEVNPAAVKQYGYSREEFLRLSITDIRPPEFIGDVVEIARKESLPGESAVLRVHRRRDGTLIDVRVHTASLEIAGTKAKLVLAENVSETIAYQRELAYRATHDTTTGLLRVRALAEKLDQRPNDGSYTIALIQLRGLQLISDTLGNEVGEQVLRAVALKLKGMATRYGRVGFQPAEDFVLAIDGVHDAEMVLEALVSVLSEPLQCQDSLHQLDARIGVAVYPVDGASAEEVVGKAGLAAHAARDEGDVLVRFDASIATRMSERLRLVGRIHRAIDRGEFELHFQPIINMHDGSPAALEALIRWRDAERGFVPPSEFIQLCEDTGLILPLGRWVLRQAAQAQRRLCDHGWSQVPIAVNVSALQFLNSDLVAEIDGVCREFGIGTAGLHVELTESSLMRKPEQALQAMRELHTLGVSISLDDFGTGFSSMSYLQSMPLDSLKIDRGFVVDVDHNPRNASICRALLMLGHNMGLHVIAEGVETRAQYDWLREHGCDQVQGFMLGRPSPLANIIEMLSEPAEEEQED